MSAFFKQRRRSLRLIVGLAALPPLLALSSCRQDMHDQPHHEPQEFSSFFSDGRIERPQVPGTVARGKLQLDTHLYQGKLNGELAQSFPFVVDRALLARGKQRYGIFCAPCHDDAGTGRGMIVRRGMKQPTSLHAERLRESPPGYFFDVISNGFGAMFDYSDRIDAPDRWAIVAYIRVLQASQNAALDDLTPEERALLAAQ